MPFWSEIAVLSAITRPTSSSDEGEGKALPGGGEACQQFFLLADTHHSEVPVGQL